MYTISIFNDSCCKIIEIIGSSDKGERSSKTAVDEAKKTLHGIHGVEITDMTAKVGTKGRTPGRYSTSTKN